MNSYHIGAIIGNFFGNLALWWYAVGFFHGMCVGALAAVLYVLFVWAWEKWRNYRHAKSYAQPTILDLQKMYPHADGEDLSKLYDGIHRK